MSCPAYAAACSDVTDGVPLRRLPLVAGRPRLRPPRLPRSAHIPGAAFLDVERDLSAPPGPQGRHPLPDAARFAAAASRAGIGAAALVVAYGSLGGAERLWWLLRHFGHDACAVIDLEAWRGPLRGGDEQIAPARFEAARARRRHDRGRRARLTPRAARRGGRAGGGAVARRAERGRPRAGPGARAPSTRRGTRRCRRCPTAGWSRTAARA